MAGDETATILGSLERQRATFAWKCGGLDKAGLQATVGASSMTLGGLIKHLALVEDDYFTRSCSGETLGRRGTRWTGTPIRIGNGALRPRTPLSSCISSGRGP